MNLIIIGRNDNESSSGYHITIDIIIIMTCYLYGF